MDAPISMAVVGVGYFGRIHAEKISRLPNAALAAVVDIDAKRAAEVGIRPLAHPGVLCGHRRRVDVSTVRTQIRAITEIGLQGRSTLC